MWVLVPAIVSLEVGVTFVLYKRTLSLSRLVGLTKITELGSREQVHFY